MNRKHLMSPAAFLFVVALSFGGAQATENLPICTDGADLKAWVERSPRGVLIAHVQDAVARRENISYIFQVRKESGVPIRFVNIGVQEFELKVFTDERPGSKGYPSSLKVPVFEIDRTIDCEIGS